MGIVVVFFIGLIKLWVSNRHMRRLEELDAEKQMRTAQTKKSGVTCATWSNRTGGKDIPFGVKALENNIEVDGIWVARMASMASRPPERKWSSMRKVRSPSAASSLANARGSRRASSKMPSRSEMAGPSSRTEHDPRGTMAGHVGALGKIQRGIKRMTWTEPGPSGAAFGAQEFREGAQARTPQRFYPPTTKADSDTTTAATPLMERRENKRSGRLVKKQSSSRGPSQSKSRSGERQHMLATGPPSIPARGSSESARTSVSSGHRPSNNTRRSSDGPQQQQQQQQQEAGPAAAAQGLPTRSTTGSMHRYPPNSSRSGGARPPRSRSLN